MSKRHSSVLIQDMLEATAAILGYIEWEKIARSRHVVVHDYFDVDPEIIWRIVTSYVPDLRLKLAAICRE